MATKKSVVTKLDERQLTVRLSYNDNSNRFFIDFWNISATGQECLISMSISKAEAEGISREIGVKILIA